MRERVKGVLEAVFLKNVVIARPSLKHAYSIAVLTRKFFPYFNFNMDSVLNRFKNKNIEYYVALLDGHTIGFVDVDFSGNSPRILGLAVLEEFQGNGVGTRLLHHALARVKKKGFKKVSLLVSEDNLRARRLYEREGFVKEGVFGKRLWGKTILVYGKKLE